MKVFNQTLNPIEILGVKLLPGMKQEYNFAGAVIPITILQETGRVVQRFVPTDTDITITPNGIISEFFEIPTKTTLKVEGFSTQCYGYGYFNLLTYLFIVLLLVIVAILLYIYVIRS